MQVDIPKALWQEYVYKYNYYIEQVTLLEKMSPASADFTTQRNKTMKVWRDIKPLWSDIQEIVDKAEGEQ
jgi:hypothetical protein